LTDELPTHDPEDYVDLPHLSDVLLGMTDPVSNVVHNFYPYPNRSSFLLGDWYWNHGSQKSQQSFSDLRKIVGNPDFNPTDIQSVNWKKIDCKLGSNEFDNVTERSASSDEWMDEDAGWRKSPISISVPFHGRTKSPGPKKFLVGDLYHRSLVNVIREKLANGPDVRQFHYEPFQLFWNTSNGQTMDNDVPVYGEMYTSKAFLEAHKTLQETPGELGCNLPRVVVALMLSSDATHLTNFGTAKLWPCYLYFGNESKYERCKPNRHLCNHIAYFQTVTTFLY
jgi:hypothetical protein